MDSKQRSQQRCHRALTHKKAIALSSHSAWVTPTISAVDPGFEIAPPQQIGGKPKPPLPRSFSPTCGEPFEVGVRKPKAEGQKGRTVNRTSASE
jgi:hypothetical protein